MSGMQLGSGRWLSLLVYADDVKAEANHSQRSSMQMAEQLPRAGRAGAGHPFSDTAAIGKASQVKEYDSSI